MPTFFKKMPSTTAPSKESSQQEASPSDSPNSTAVSMLFHFYSGNYGEKSRQLVWGFGNSSSKTILHQSNPEQVYTEVNPILFIQAYS